MTLLNRRRAGTCVGQRNYRTFLGFLFTTTALLVLDIAVVVVAFLTAVRQSGTGSGVDVVIGTFSRAPAIVSFFIFSCCFVFGLLSMSCYHFWITVKGQTTNEHVGEPSPRPGRPV